jgi:cytochrome c553
LWRKLSAEQQDTLLAHELAHLRRGDHWVRRLELLVLGLYWWHPVVWWARRRLQEAEEECCDALVVSILPDAATAYASVLVETVAFLSQTRLAALVGASGAGQVPLLKRRLTMILTETSSRKSSRIGFWIVLGLGALLLPLAPGAAKPEASEPQSPPQPARRKVDSEREILQAHAVQSCVVCHEAQPMHAHELLRKPQSWKEAHEEIIRLMDEVRRRQAQLSESPNRLLAAAERNRGEEIEKLQDEIELLKLKVQLKDARRTGTQARLGEVQRRLHNMLAMDKRNPNTIPLDTIQDIRTTETGLKADAVVQEIELKEAELLLQQAERRLGRLQRPAEKTDGDGRSKQEKRLRELEQKVESLLKEIQKLRREMRPDKPGGQSSGPDDVKR